MFLKEREFFYGSLAGGGAERGEDVGGGSPREAAGE